MKISVVFPSVNDQVEAIETVKSIRETSPAEVEIVVVDDCSAQTLCFPPELNVILHRNLYRIGSGASRHVGAQRATGDYVIMTDSHCRFDRDWFKAVSETVNGAQDVVYCGVCHGFTPKSPPFVNPCGIYYGANLQFVGHNPGNPHKLQVLEGIWSGEREDDCEMSCVMGANYVVPRKRYLELGGMQYFRVWGVEEQILSLKFWLSGGEVRLMKGFKTWHRFRDGEKMPFRLELWNLIYNKLFVIHTMFPDNIAAHMISKFPKGFDLNKAQEMIKNDWRLVECERAHNKKTLIKDVGWMLNKFQIPLL